jgi:hypothetical protein
MNLRHDKTRAAAVTAVAPAVMTAPTQRVAVAQGQAVFGRRNLSVAAALFGIALLYFLALEVRFGINPLGVSAAPYQVYQAESLLHGHWDVALPPQMTADVIMLHGKRYIYYPPMPAILLLPFVAIWGRATSDIFFTTVISAINLPLIYLLFEQVRANGLTRRP